MLLCRMAPCMLQKKRTWAPLNNPILHGVSHSKTPTKEQSTERATEPLKTTPGEEKTNDSAQRSPWVGEDSNKQKNHQKKKRKKQSTTPPLYTTVTCTPLASLSPPPTNSTRSSWGAQPARGEAPALSPSTTSNLPQNLHLHRQIREGVQTLEGPWLPPRGSAAQPSRRGEPPPRACVFPEPAAAFAQPR